MTYAVMPPRSIPTLDSVVYNNSTFDSNLQENCIFARILLYTVEPIFLSEYVRQIFNISDILSKKASVGNSINRRNITTNKIIEFCDG